MENIDLKNQFHHQVIELTDFAITQLEHMVRALEPHGAPADIRHRRIARERFVLCRDRLLARKDQILDALGDQDGMEKALSGPGE